MAAGGGVLTREDLAAYRVVERAPLVEDYRGWRVLLNPPPAGGGTAVARLLRVFSTLDPASFRFGDGDHLARLALTMREGERLRGVPLDDERAMAEASATVRSFSRGTTHLTVADAEGNVASMTTSNGEGSGYVVPGTGGIMLNNMMGEDDLHPAGWHQDPPGVRISSMMCPTVVLGDEGPRLALGTGGSKRIRTALFQVLTHVLDLGLPLADAIRAPRVHWDGESVQAEPGYDDAAYARLAEALPVNRWAVGDMYFGGVHAVEPSGDAAADARREGHAMVVT
jgi:gamma-glutamyltranspeptidase/glutathione hydrolase